MASGTGKTVPIFPSGILCNVGGNRDVDQLFCNDFSGKIVIGMIEDTVRDRNGLKSCRLQMRSFMPRMSRLCTGGSGSRLPAVFDLFMVGFCRGRQRGIFIVTMHLVNEMPAFAFQIRVFLCKGRDFLTELVTEFLQVFQLDQELDNVAFRA